MTLRGQALDVGAAILAVDAVEGTQFIVIWKEVHAQGTAQAAGAYRAVRHAFL
jgi:hypothetical protein